MEITNNKLVNRGYSKKVLGVIIGIITLLFLIACYSIYFAGKESGFYFLAFFSALLAMLVYFITLFYHEKIEIDIKKRTVVIQYVYGCKKSKKNQLDDMLGYYIYAGGGLRRIVLVLKIKVN